MRLRNPNRTAPTKWSRDFILVSLLASYLTGTYVYLMKILRECPRHGTWGLACIAPQVSKTLFSRLFLVGAWGGGRGSLSLMQLYLRWQYSIVSTILVIMLICVWISLHEFLRVARISDLGTATSRNGWLKQAGIIATARNAYWVQGISFRPISLEKA